MKNALVQTAGLAMVCWCMAFAGDAPAAVEKATFDFGPIASRTYDLNNDERLRILGPLFERARAGDGMDLVAARPLFSTVDDPARDRALIDYAWPVGMSRTIHDENQWRFLFFFGFNHTTNDPGDRYRTWLIPFYFQGRDASGETYRALFPLGGTIKDFVGRDEVSFVLFPLFSRSALNDISTVNVFWPLVSKTTSSRGHISRGRVFPLYGYNIHDGKFDKRFILWPFYTRAHYQYEKGHGHSHMLFPLYGVVDLDTEKTLWLLPPFFRFTDGQQQDITYAPWPFFQRRVGNGVDQLYVWPIWGRKKFEERDTRFYLWPFFWTQTDRRPGEQVTRFHAVPFFSHTAVRAATTNMPAAADAEVLARRHKCWPLYSYRRDGDASRLRFPELWPFADAPSVERNLAPFWSLVERRTHGEKSDTEILWGLYRQHDRGPDERYVSLFPLADYRRAEGGHSWNLLKGLIGYEQKASRKSLKLLYILRIPLNGESEP